MRSSPNPALQGACHETARVDPHWLASAQAGRLAYLSEFVEEAKASGLVQRAIDRAGLHGYEVVAPENPNARK